MAYNEQLGDRIRGLLDNQDGITERKMFGGLAFMLDGNMLVGVIDDNLMVRVGKENHTEALLHEHVRPMDFTGRPSRGMVFVAAQRLSDEQLAGWIQMAVQFAGGLPPKPARARAKGSS